MKILFVSPFLPYPGVPHAGGKLLHYLISLLIRRHSVHLVTRYYPGEERHFTDLRGKLSGLDVVPADGPVESSSLRSILEHVGSIVQLARRRMLLPPGAVRSLPGGKHRDGVFLGAAT